MKKKRRESSRVETVDIHSDLIMWELWPLNELGFYLKGNRKILEDFKKGNGVICFTCFK